MTLRDKRQLEFALEEVKSSTFNIHSVKRLSDGEIFTVGDKVSVGIIKAFSFYPKPSSLIPIVEHHIFGDVSRTLCGLKKKGEHLFITEDNVTICKGDEYWFVADCDPPYTAIAGSYSGKDKDHKYFSTKAKAQEYIDNNKPMYSKQQIKDILYSFECGEYIFKKSFDKPL